MSNRQALYIFCFILTFAGIINGLEMYGWWGLVLGPFWTLIGAVVFFGISLLVLYLFSIRPDKKRQRQYWKQFPNTPCHPDTGGRGVDP